MVGRWRMEVRRRRCTICLLVAFPLTSRRLGFFASMLGLLLPFRGSWVGLVVVVWWAFVLSVSYTNYLSIIVAFLILVLRKVPEDSPAMDADAEASIPDDARGSKKSPCTYIRLQEDQLCGGTTSVPPTKVEAYSSDYGLTRTGLMSLCGEFFGQRVSINMTTRTLR